MYTAVKILSKKLQTSGLTIGLKFGGGGKASWGAQMFSGGIFPVAPPPSYPTASNLFCSIMEVEDFLALWLYRYTGIFYLKIHAVEPL